ncbi:hypothetical protein CF326_g5968 [Tilletia indica]|nr:hypothetical protein CF326_g5968 [Tilletia indica]
MSAVPEPRRPRIPTGPERNPQATPHSPGSDNASVLGSAHQRPDGPHVESARRRQARISAIHWPSCHSQLRSDFHECFRRSRTFQASHGTVAAGYLRIRHNTSTNT